MRVHLFSPLALLAVVLAQIEPTNLENALAQLPALAERAVNSSGVPGLSLAVVYNGSIVYAGGFGVRSVNDNQTLDADTVFQLASVSKPIASTIVSAIITASNGTLTWTNHTNSPTKVGLYSDPWITEELMLADGFSHRSGLYGLAGDDLELLGFDRDTILSRLQYMQPVGPFRASYAYSNYGITLAAIKASDSAGVSWEEAAQQYLYGPLGMTDSSSTYSEFLARMNRAALHIPASPAQANGNSSDNGNSTSTTRWAAAVPRDPAAQAPAGGATSSANDLAKWLQLHLSLGLIPNSTERLISQEALNETRLPHIVRGIEPSTNTTAYYGLGWNVDYLPTGNVIIEHAGAFSQGTRTLVRMDVENGLGMVVLANCFPTGWPEGITDTFWDLVFSGNSTRDWVAFWNQIYDGLGGGDEDPFAMAPMGTAAMLGVDAYVGTYVNDYVGVVQVEAGDTMSAGGNSTTGGDLVMSFPGSSNLTFPLTHWDRDLFTMNLVPQEPDSKEAVMFAVGPDGNATGLTLVAMNNNGGGVLMRQQDETGGGE